MGQQQDTPSFPDWVRLVFDHPVTDPAWYWSLTDDTSELPASEAVMYLTQLFTDPEAALASFTDAQINQGLWYLVSNACSSYMFALLDPKIAWPARQAAIRAIQTLFVRFFAKRCSPHLSHLDEPKANVLNSVCYMWWDLFPTWGQPEEPRHTLVDAELLHVMGATLRLDSIACQESALHGLGHWSLSYPAVAQQTIDAFLKRSPRLDPRIRDYALAARAGCVQ